jgi:hypothetical protein
VAYLFDRFIQLMWDFRCLSGLTYKVF